MLQIMAGNVAGRKSGLRPENDENQQTARFYTVNCNI